MLENKLEELKNQFLRDLDEKLGLTGERKQSDLQNGFAFSKRDAI